MKLLLLLAALAAALPQPTGRVTDLTGALSESGKEKLRQLSRGLDRDTGAELAVAVVASFEGLDRDDYANRLFRQWGIGKKGKDNGLLIVVCPSERKARVEVGYGLEGVLPDALAGRVLIEEMTPLFKEGKYEQGILLGAEKLASIVREGKPASQEDRAPARSGAAARMDKEMQWLLVPFFSIFVALGCGALGGASVKRDPFLMIWGGGFAGIPALMALVALGLPGRIALLLVGVAGFLVGRRLALNPPKWTQGRGGGGGWSGGSSYDSGSSWSSSDSGSSSSSSSDSFGGGSSGGGGAGSSW